MNKKSHGRKMRTDHKKKTILIVEDEKILRVTLEDALRKEAYSVLAADTGLAGLEALRTEHPDVVLTDIRLPGADGIEILRECRTLHPEAVVVMMTAFGTIKSAVEAIKLGAYDYLTKPFAIEEFLHILANIDERDRLREENIRLKQELQARYRFHSIVGKSISMQEIYSLIERVSQSDSTVLITGESGTGKELVANAIHYNSPRKDRPLIKVSCAALPETLLESELFGYEKGAFTGALKQKPGRFDLAQGGTLLLDEISEMPLGVQVKLLRVLQEREFERVGGSETIKVDVRVLAATNADLERLVKYGTFRKDLFYRLNVIPIHIPRLSRRREDIPLLIEHFLDKYCTKMGCRASFSEEAMKLLMHYNYPGNVRELENIVERALNLAKNEILSPDALPASMAQGKPHRNYTSLDHFLREQEKEYIENVLRMTEGNKTRAAEILGISRKNLWEKMSSHKLDDE
jgi:two-component system response regulator AtoC